MADYYTNFSVVLPLTKEQQDYALDLVKQVEGYLHNNQQLPADFPESLREEVESWPFEVAPVKDGIWLHSQYGGQEVACEFIQHLLQKFEFAPAVAFEWKRVQNRFKALRKQADKTHLFSPDTHLCVKCGTHADDDLVENSPCKH